MTDIFIHESAHVSPDANIGDGTKIWINAQIREGSSIGKNCIISKDTYIDTGVTIGSGCKIQNSVSIYQGVTLADNVFVGPNACFTNDKVPRAFNANWKVIDTKILEGASIGANATVVCGITVGKFAMIGAGSTVTKDVEDYTLVIGNPAVKVGYVCECGERLVQFHCKQCKKSLNIREHE